MSLNLATLLRESAKTHATRPAIVLGETTLDYATLDELARRFAGALRGLGVTSGQHVALMLPNVPHFTIAYFGGHYAASPVVPLNVLLTEHEIAYHLEDADAVALVVWEGFLPQALAAFSRTESCKHLIVCRADRSDLSAPDGALNFSALVGRATPVAEVPPTSPDDTAVLLYTSGTTGRPKGAELSHFNLFFNAQYVRRDLMPADPTSVGIGLLPLFHSFGQTCVQNALLASGSKIVLLPRFEPDAAMATIQKYGVTHLAGVPTMYFALLHHPEAGKHDLSSLRFCVSGGSSMPVEVMRAFDQKYGVNILEGYGLSETSPVASFNTLARPKKAGSIGLPIWGCELRLEDEHGNVVEAVDTPGEVCIKGHNVMKGYWKKPEATREAIREGWFHSGDIATRDSDGYYFIVDRKKDMILRGGFNVYPREIEEVLYAHPAVAEAAVIGIPHASHGEEVKAIIAKKAGHEAVTSEEIIAYCKERLAAYKYPRVVEFMSSLPKGPTGKILKRELRAKA
jgi:long-chain acyl-CoA synthetase